MLLLVEILILCVSVYLLYVILSRNNGVNLTYYKRLKDADKIIKYDKAKLKKRDRTAKTISNLYSFLVGMGIFKINTRQMRNLEYYALRLNIVINDVSCGPEFIYVIKAGIATIFGIVVSAMSLYNLNCIILIPVSFLVYNLPDLVFDSIISDKDDEIEKEVNPFFSKFYYRIKVKQNLKIKMSDIAALYLPTAGKEMQLLCKSFIADCSVSEHYALERLKDNYKIPNIQRMAILILNTLNGSADSTKALEVFKNELDRDTELYLKEQLDKKEENAMRVIYVCYGMVFELIMIYALNLF